MPLSGPAWPMALVKQSAPCPGLSPGTCTARASPLLAWNFLSLQSPRTAWWGHKGTGGPVQSVGYFTDSAFLLPVTCICCFAGLPALFAGSFITDQGDGSSFLSWVLPNCWVFQFPTAVSSSALLHIAFLLLFVFCSSLPTALFPCSDFSARIEDLRLLVLI